MTAAAAVEVFGAVLPNSMLRSQGWLVLVSGKFLKSTQVSCPKDKIFQIQ